MNQNDKSMVILSKSLNVKQFPDFISKKIAVAYEAYSYKLTGKKVGYLTIQLPSGKSGWICTGKKDKLYIEWEKNTNKEITDNIKQLLYWS